LLSEDEHAVLKGYFVGMPPAAVETKITRLCEVVSAFRHQTAQRSASPRIGRILSQLAQIERAAERACEGRRANLPSEILPETFQALAGRYPYSNLDLARVTLETLRDPSRSAGVRTAVVNASIGRHVPDAALCQHPGEAHLVAARCWPFPSAAAEKYFYEDLTEPTAAAQRRRLHEFIRGGPFIARNFVRHVHERVRLATRDPGKRNTGARRLYDWAEPAPLPRLVFEVMQTVLEPAIERPGAAVRDRVIGIVDLLVNAGRRSAQDFRDADVVSSTLTIWVALHQHRMVLDRLSGMMGEMSNPIRSLRWRRRRLLLETCYDVVLQSSAEVWRRAAMGDFHDLCQNRARRSSSNDAIRAGASGPGGRSIPRKPRATGSPVPFLDLAEAAAAVNEFAFRKALRSALNIRRRDAACDDVRRN
jgi:hypothetical protein